MLYNSTIWASVLHIDTSCLTQAGDMSVARQEKEKDKEQLRPCRHNPLQGHTLKRGNDHSTLHMATENTIPEKTSLAINCIVVPR
jgi:hypothetical protein